MHPILFQTSFFSLTTLTLFTAISIIAATIAIIKLSAINGLKIQFLSEHFFKLILSGIIGGRLLGILLNYKFYISEISINGFFQIFKLWDNGFSAIGAILGVIACLYYLCKKYDQDIFKWLDVIAPALVLALAIVHIGNFFQGSNYGKPTSLPWGTNFENPIIKYTVPIHPTQMYAFLYSAFTLTATYFLNKHSFVTNGPSGLLSLIIITLYSFFRFLEDFVRGDDTTLILGIRLSQILALIVLGISLRLLLIKLKQIKSEPAKNDSTN